MDNTTHTIVIGETHFENAQGALVPVDQVRPIDRDRDSLVRELTAEAEALSATIAEFRKSVMARIDGFVKKSARVYRAGLGGVKGNVQLISYDGAYKVIRAIDERTTFDERLTVAHELIKQCIEEWGKGAPAPLLTLVTDAFRTDKQGYLNPNRIRALRRYDFDHPKWRKAMKAIADAEQVQETRAYVRFYRRGSDGEYQPISLDVAKG